MATRIIAVLNQKGGVGKTTTSVNLGAALAQQDREVLLIDMDPQANLTVHLGLDPHRVKATSYSVLLGEHSLPEAMLETAVPGLRVVPSTLALANAEIQLASAVGRELILTEAIHNWLHPEPPLGTDAALPFVGGSPVTAPPADFVLMDCPPSLGILTMNALCAATDVLLPIQSEFFALQGVTGILESIKAVKRLNKDLRLSMVLPSMVDYRTKLAKDVVEEVRKYFGSLVTRTVIRTNIKLAEAPSYGQTIFEYDPNSRGAIDYGDLADEVLETSDPPIASRSRMEEEAAERADDEAMAAARLAVAGDRRPETVPEPRTDDVPPVGRSQEPTEAAFVARVPPAPIRAPDPDFFRALELTESVTGPDVPPPIPVEGERFRSSVREEIPVLPTAVAGHDADLDLDLDLDGEIEAALPPSPDAFEPEPAGVLIGYPDSDAVEPEDASDAALPPSATSGPHAHPSAPAPTVDRLPVPTAPGDPEAPPRHPLRDDVTPDSNSF